MEAVQAALDAGAREREERERREDTLLRRYAWDRIVGEMHAIIRDRLARKPAARGRG